MADIVTISVSMPAEMQRLVMERIKARFFGNISEYFRHLVRQDLDSSANFPSADVPPTTDSAPTRTLGFRESIREQAAEARQAASRTPVQDEISDEEVQRLRRKYPIKAIERLHAKTRPGTHERLQYERILKVLQGEGTPKQRGAWWSVVDVEFLALIQVRISLGDDPDESGGALVKAPRPPKPGSDSARAKPPRAKDR